MTYCDKAGMVARFGEVELIRLTDPDGSVIDDAAINAALSDAVDEIDTYLAVRHSLPLTSTPKLLVRICADIARYRLYDDRMIEEVEKRYNDKNAQGHRQRHCQPAHRTTTGRDLRCDRTENQRRPGIHQQHSGGLLMLSLEQAQQEIQNIMDTVMLHQRRRSLFERLGRAMVTDTHMNFRRQHAPDGTPWAPLKIRKGQILSDTRRLRNSISHRTGNDEVEVGTNVKYAMFNEALEAVSNHLATALNQRCNDVQSHPGRFTEAELTRLLTANKAVRVAIENTQSVTVTGQGIQQARLLMAAYVICSDTRTAPRHEAALTIAEAIIEQLPFNRFGTLNLRPIEPKTIAAENLYSGEIDRKGIALWGISWEQTLES